MIVQNKSVYLLYFSLFVSESLCAKVFSAPEEFRDFFIETDQIVDVVVAGERSGIDIPAVVNYENFRIESNSEASRILSEFLKEKGLSSEAVSKLLSQVESGIQTDPECEGRLERCILDTSSGMNRFVFDFDNLTLKLFVAPQSLRNDVDQVEYESPMNGNPAVINWSNLYASTDFSGREQVTFRNETIIGLPLGAIELDTEYASNDDDFNIYTALYDVEYDSIRLKAGRNRYNNYFNSTDYLNNGARFAGDSVYVGSSGNLIQGKNNSQQRIYYYAPQNGQLEIYRDERLIINRTVSEGRQYIDYSELPKGAYTIQLLLKVAGEPVVDEVRQIVNNNSYSIKSGEFDYVLGLGMFDDYDYQNVNHGDDFERYYARGMINYRASEGFMLGGGVTLHSDDEYYQLGGKYTHSDSVFVEYSVGKTMESDAKFYTGQLTASPFFIDYRHLSLDDSTNDFSLINQLYGEDSFVDFGVGVSGVFLGGNSYLRYNYFDYDSKNYLGGASEVRMITGGWNYRLPLGTVNVNVDYSTSNYSKDEFRALISFTLDLGDGFSSQTNISSNQNGFDNVSQYLRMDTNHNDWYSNTSVGTKLYRDSQVNAELSSSISGRTNRFNANAYGYVDENGTKTLSGSLSGTQIFSSDGVAFSNEKGRSFAKVTKNQIIDDDSNQNWPTLSVNRDGRYNINKDLDEVETIIKLQDFSQYRLEVDSGTTNTDVTGKHLRAFAIPGSLHGLTSTIIDLASKVVVLDDINGEPIDSLQCIGDGCVSVEPLSSDGVYRINFHSDKEIRLISRKGMCVVENSDENHSKGYCLPGLDTELDNNWNETSKLFGQHHEQELLLYLGRFTLGTESESIIKKLYDNSIAHKLIEINGEAFIYIVEVQRFNQYQIDLLMELDAYVLHRDAELDLVGYIKTGGSYD
ncbi:TcfC E-set like domain-containing protein [Vibrio diabolicus]